MEHEKNSAVEGVELVLDEDCSIENARNLRDALLEANEGATDVSVNMGAVKRIDTTSLQILCSAHHAAVQRGRELRLTNVGRECSDVMRLLGFVRHVGCRDDIGGTCLWKGR